MLREGTSSLQAVAPSPFPLLYRILRNACRPILDRAFSLSVEGAEHLPAGGPFILAANHHNYLDGVVLAVAVPQKIAFPEGPFSLEGRLVQGQPGVALIALRAGVPVVPVGLLGTYEALAERRWHLPRPYPLTVRFGRTLSFARIRREARIPRALRQEVTRRIMGEIAHLLLGAGGTG